ncbi:unnamed protein product [Anisakis simplex]|uniref:Velvet domain-containing protein n=1 Tax=Anisakis simplex TaxID=6269 RepID=A0A0M3J191_ANISI|nr:unnamed protein product [Anisakis simplex]
MSECTGRLYAITEDSLKLACSNMAFKECVERVCRKLLRLFRTDSSKPQMRDDKKRHYTAPTIARANAPQRQWQPNEQPGILYNNFSAPRANLSEYATSPRTQTMAPAPVPISAPAGAPTPLYQTHSFGTPSYQQTPPPRPQSQPHSQLYTNRTNTPQQPSPYAVQSSYRPPQPDTIIYQQVNICHFI